MLKFDLVEVLNLLILIINFYYSDQTIIKPYTVINESLSGMNSLELKGRIINLMIKYYHDGEFTPNLRKLEIGIQLIFLMVFTSLQHFNNI